jgi:hypothetical protein
MPYKADRAVSGTATMTVSSGVTTRRLRDDHHRASRRRRGIEIESLSTRLVDDIDLQGLLALADVPAGYRGIRIEMDIKAKNASDADLDPLSASRRRTPQCATPCVDRCRLLWNGCRCDREPRTGSQIGGPRPFEDARDLARAFESRVNTGRVHRLRGPRPGSPAVSRTEI